VKAFAAGVRPEDLDIDIARDMVTISGHRKEGAMAETGDYLTQELFWGSFTRTIMLPEEIDPEQTIATEKNGLIIIRLPKLDKKRRTKVKVKSR
jgi:HSP20 family protein